MVSSYLLRTAPWAAAVAANALLVSIAIAAFSAFVSPAFAQEEIGAETGEALGTGTSTTGTETAATEAAATEATATEATATETTEPETTGEEEEEEKKGPYHNKVLGKLWIEGSFGPSRYAPGGLAVSRDAFAQTFGSVKGPQFGVSLLGGQSERVSHIGVVYRQANYDVFKLMKTGLAAQWAWRTPYVHPTVRLDVGYAHIFGGSIFPPAFTNSPEHGFFTTFGFGVRVPIVRWLSFAGTFDWSLISLISAKGGSGIAVGSQIGGTFALTVHLIGVDKN